METETPFPFQNPKQKVCGEKKMAAAFFQLSKLLHDKVPNVKSPHASFAVLRNHTSCILNLRLILIRSQ